MPNTPAPDDRCVQHTIALDQHATRLSHLEERSAVHDRTLFGYNGQQAGIVSTVRELDEARHEKSSNSFLIKLTLLAVVLEGVAQLAIAAWKS